MCSCTEYLCAQVCCSEIKTKQINEIEKENTIRKKKNTLKCRIPGHVYLNVAVDN